MITRGTATLTVWLWASLPAQASLLDEARDLHRQGQLDAALIAYAGVADSNGAPADRAVAMNNACVILTDQGSHHDALAQCEGALALRRELGDPRGLARTLNNVGRARERLGDYTAAHALQREALHINEVRQDTEAQVINHLNLGVLETQTNRYDAALRHYELAQALIDSAPDAPWASHQRALVALNTGVALEQIGAYKEALHELDKARDMALESAEYLLGDVQINRGVVLRNLGDPVAALSSYAAALEVFEERGDKGAVANVVLNQGLVHWQDLGATQRGLEMIRDAMNDARQRGDAGLADEAWYYATRAALELGDTASIDALLAREVPAEPIASASAWREQDIEARVALARGDLTQASRASQRAINAIETQRAALRDDRNRHRILRDRRAAYALAIDVLFQQYTAAPEASLAQDALTLVGRAKALALLEMTGGVRPDWQTALEDAQLIEVFFADRQLYVWRVTATSIVWHALDATTIGEQANALYDALRRGEPASAELLASLAAVTNDLAPGTTPLIIAPDGALGRVPFELFDGHSTASSAGGRPMHYVATATAYRPARYTQPAASGPPSLVAFARASGATTSAHPALQDLTTLAHTRDEVEHIATFFGERATVFVNNAATETALYGSSVATNTGSRHSGPMVLHLATHAVVDSRLDDGAVLLLTADTYNDGLISVTDVSEMPLNVSLTVLSACSTSVGGDLPGAPLANLTGAFMAAGSRAVVATLWDIDDQSTRVFMEQFYARLAQGMTASKALHDTKRMLARSRDWSSPSVWSAFVLYGDTSRIFVPSKTSRSATAGWLAAALSALLVLWLGNRWRRRTRLPNA